MRKIILISVLILASTLVTLLCLEAGVRIANGIPIFSTQNFVAQALNTLSVQTASIYDPTLGWVQRDYLKMDAGNGTFTTGKFGVRMPSAQVRDIDLGAVLAVGDSLTVGSEVSDDESWPAHLEKLIGVPVINGAVGGYSVDQTTLHAENLVPLLKPRTLLVEVTGTTSINSGLKVYSGAPKPYFRIENGALALHNVPVPREATTADIGRLRGFFGHFYLVQYVMIRLDALQWWVIQSRYQWGTSASEGMNITCSLMGRLASLGDRYNMRVGVVVQYGATEVTGTNVGWDRPGLLQCIQAHGLAVIDSYPELRAIYDRGGEEVFKRLWVMHDNDHVYGHMSAEGNSLLADLILKQLFADDIPKPSVEKTE